jgi:hypothetical protein
VREIRLARTSDHTARHDMTASTTGARAETFPEP